MLNTWVKNVNNQGIKFSINSAFNYTVTCNLGQSNINKWVKLYFNNLNITNKPTYLFTLKKQIINLLNKVFTHNPQNLLIRTIKEN